ncbi:MAG: hypothetical protein RLO22_09470 [Sneathiellaceae bacterium]
MRQGNQAVGTPYWHSHPIFQEQRAGYSIDDLDRLGMQVPERTRTSAIWRRVPVGDLPQALRDGDERGGPVLLPGDPAADEAPPADPAPEDLRMVAAIRDWSALEARHDLPLRGSFADFLEAFRLTVTGISVRGAKTRDLSYDDLSAVAGEDAAEAFLRGEIGLRELQYRARHRDGLGAYRLGEAQLQELGYYRRLPHPPASGEPYLPKPATETAWHGWFTGLRGIRSVEDLLQVDTQEHIVLEAFARHLRDIAGLLPSGTLLGDLVGRPIAGAEAAALPAHGPGGHLTLSALLAAAQLHGPEALVDALLHPESLARGRAMDHCLRTFAGYATPFDGMPQPSSGDIDHVLSRVRSITEGRPVGQRPASPLPLQCLNNPI